MGGENLVVHLMGLTNTSLLRIMKKRGNNYLVSAYSPMLLAITGFFLKSNLEEFSSQWFGIVRAITEAQEK